MTSYSFDKLGVIFIEQKRVKDDKNGPFKNHLPDNQPIQPGSSGPTILARDLPRRTRDQPPHQPRTRHQRRPGERDDGCLLLPCPLRQLVRPLHLYIRHQGLARQELEAIETTRDAAEKKLQSLMRKCGIERLPSANGGSITAAEEMDDDDDDDVDVDVHDGNGPRAQGTTGDEIDAGPNSDRNASFGEPLLVNTRC